VTEDNFNLTPVDIRAQEFRKSLRGYDTGDVDDFRHRVADEMERLLKERADTGDKIQQLREQLKAFRDREKALNDALVMAQQLRGETEQAARKEADLIAREARLQADATLADARGEERSVRRDIEVAQRQFSAYLSSFRSLLERYLSEVDALEAHERDGSAPGQQVRGGGA
jgi:DivIVA domain-containing protein